MSHYDERWIDKNPPRPDLTDAQIIKRCAAVGIRWLTVDGEAGSPGSFDMVSMKEMRALLAMQAPQPAPAGRELSDAEIVVVLASLGIDATKSKYGFAELQVHTTVPGIRQIVAAYLAAAAPPAGQAPQAQVKAREIDPVEQEQLEKGRWCPHSGDPRNAYAEAYDEKHGYKAPSDGASDGEQR